MSDSAVFEATYTIQQSPLELFVGTSTTPVSGVSTLAEAIAWLERNAQTGTSYRMVLYENVSSAYSPLNPGSNSNVSISLEGNGGERTIQLTGTGPLFTVRNCRLTLGNNITLKGVNNDNNSLVSCFSGGTLIMNNGARITGNNNGATYGGGVIVDGGTFTMNGGTISGNTALSGGGVSVRGGGVFKKTGGTIYGSGEGANSNTATRSYISAGTLEGHAVSLSASGGSYNRNATAGPSVNLDSTDLSAAGGWDSIH
jgi:hypothetical protein